MTPYYQDEAVTIYHGDCREILPTLTADVLVTDPPYGVELGTSDSRGNTHGLAKLGYASFNDSFDNWTTVVPPVIATALDRVKRAAVFPGKHLTWLPAPAIVGGIYCPSGSGRNPWGFTTLMPIFFYGSSPTLHKGATSIVLESTATSERNGHPCPKPYEWMLWLVEMTSLPDEMVLDPFMGSGTTLAAAKRKGRKAIGIEIEERYCEIAAKRCAQRVLDFA